MSMTCGATAYVYDLRGNRWWQAARLAAPDPQPRDHFGLNVAASSNWVAVSAIGHFVTNTLPGAVYAFNVPPLVAPKMSLIKTASGLKLDWSGGFDGYVLESSTNLASPNWEAMTPQPATNSITIGTTNALGFFRLRHP